MKAVVFHGGDKGLKVEDIPVPQISDGQILVKVAACGVCHTDLHYIEHGVPTFKKPPIVLGHEASGLVEEVGVDVDGFTDVVGNPVVPFVSGFTTGTLPSNNIARAATRDLG